MAIIELTVSLCNESFPTYSDKLYILIEPSFNPTKVLDVIEFNCIELTGILILIL